MGTLRKRDSEQSESSATATTMVGDHKSEMPPGSPTRENEELIWDSQMQTRALFDVRFVVTGEVQAYLFQTCLSLRFRRGRLKARAHVLISILRTCFVNLGRFDIDWYKLLHAPIHDFGRAHVVFLRGSLLPIGSLWTN